METTINQRIELILKECGYKSKRAFAEKIGIAQTSFNDILSKGAEPKFSTLHKIIIAEPLISAKWLLTGEGTMFLQDGIDKLSQSDSDLEKLREENLRLQGEIRALERLIQGEKKATVRKNVG